MTNFSHRVILDCDPGVDDMLAIVLALLAPGSNVDLLGITTVAGNVAIEHTSRNAANIVALLGRTDIPVFAGCSRPLMRTVGRRGSMHGSRGLGSVELDEPEAVIDSRHAVDFIIETVLGSERPVTLCAVGPLTNLAMAIIKAPQIVGKLDRVVIMGGAAFVPGNITPAAEFNVFVDPHAAQVVFGSGAAITMIGLDVTLTVRMPAEAMDLPWATSSRAGRAVAQMIRDYASGDPALHDPCTIAWLMRPDLFTLEAAHVEVDCADGPNLGRTVAAVSERHLGGRSPNCNIVKAADVAAVVGLLLSALARLSEDAR